MKKNNVVALCDRERKGFYTGLEIIDILRSADFVGSKEFIMIRDRQLALEVYNELQKMVLILNKCIGNRIV